MNDISKDYFLFKLNAIIREVTCMNPSEFQERFKDGNIKFDRFSFGEPKEKVKTVISMDKENIG